jgi:hypothetical protein
MVAMAVLISRMAVLTMVMNMERVDVTFENQS